MKKVLADIKVPTPPPPRLKKVITRVILYIYGKHAENPALKTGPWSQFAGAVVSVCI